MNYPKPSGIGASQSGMNQAGAWHNYFLDQQIGNALASGEPIRSPISMKRLTDQLLTSGQINSTERTYLYQYADKYAGYWDTTNRMWTRGMTSLPASFVDEIQAIHTAAANDPEVTSIGFKTISNIALGSSMYWRDGGAWTPQHPELMSIAGIAFADVMGGLAGLIVGIVMNHSGWDIVVDIVAGAVMGSLTGAGNGKSIRPVDGGGYYGDLGL